MAADSTVTRSLVPESVYVSRGLTEAEEDVIVCRYEGEVAGKDEEWQLVYNPEGFSRMLIAMLASLGFTESDLTYIAERFEREFLKDAE